jgi:CHAD domain-containing protein
MNARPSYDRLWRKRLDAFDAVWPGFLENDATALHKARVASRRIREALPVVGAAAPADKVKKLQHKMREVTRSLGPVRELDVQIGLLDKEADNDATSAAALAVVRRELATRRQAIREKLAEDPPVGDVKKLVRKLERVAEVKGKKSRRIRQETAWRAALGAQLMRRAKKLAAAIDDAGPLYASDRVHNVRIAIKKLRYALEFALEAGEPSAASAVKILRKQQERLGRLNDLEILSRRVREAEASPRVGGRLSDLAAYADSIDLVCRRLHAEFVEQRDALLECIADVRRNVVSGLTTTRRPQARVARQAGRSKSAPARSKARP